MNIELPPPPNLPRERIDYWVDEAIWGHRFYNDQTPWLVILEFLCVFNSIREENESEVFKGIEKPSKKDLKHEEINVRIPHSLDTRSLVFRNSSTHFSQDSSVGDSEAKWKDLSTDFGDERENAEFTTKFIEQLRTRFKDFDDFKLTVEFLRASAVDAGHVNRRWTSKFIFPFGADCLYADLRESDKSPDRRFFARSGELLYLMLNRASPKYRTLLKERIDERLLRRSGVWNRIVRELNQCVTDAHGESGDESKKLPIGYLPLAKHSEYDELAKTWLSVLNLKANPELYTDALVRLTALHLTNYLISRSMEEINAGVSSHKVKLVLDVDSPRSTALFELSRDNLEANKKITSRAITSYVRRKLRESNWGQIESRNVKRARKIIADIFRYTWKDDNINISSKEEILDFFIGIVQKRHNQHLRRVHHAWLTDIGLVSARRGKGTWYSPSDPMLQALVYAIVDRKRMEYQRFLKELHSKFGIVVGVNEAIKAYGSNLPVDQYYFKQNAGRLEERLRILGLVNRLSDDCAFVVNRYRG